MLCKPCDFWDKYLEGNCNNHLMSSVTSMVNGHCCWPSLTNWTFSLPGTTYQLFLDLQYTSVMDIKRINESTFTCTTKLYCTGVSICMSHGSSLSVCTAALHVDRGSVQSCSLCTSSSHVDTCSVWANDSVVQMGYSSGMALVAFSLFLAAVTYFLYDNLNFQGIPQSNSTMKYLC